MARYWFQNYELTEEAKGIDTDVFQDDSLIKEVTRKLKEVGDGGNRENVKSRSNEHTMVANEVEIKQQDQKAGKRELGKTKGKKPDEHVMADSHVRYLKDQLIKGRIYLSLSATRSNVRFVKKLRVRMKEVQKALGDATKDADLPKNAYEKLKAMDQTLAKGEQIHYDCTAIVRKLRAIIHSTEEQLQVHQKQASFFTHLTAKTVPKGLHCLPLRLSTEYYSLNASVQQFPNQENLDDPNLFHYALFSDNVLATGVVVNSTVTNAQGSFKTRVPHCYRQAELCCKYLFVHKNYVDARLSHCFHHYFRDQDLKNLILVQLQVVSVLHLLKYH